MTATEAGWVWYRDRRYVYDVRHAFREYDGRRATQSACGLDGLHRYERVPKEAPYGTRCGRCREVMGTWPRIDDLPS